MDPKKKSSIFEYVPQNSGSCELNEVELEHIVSNNPLDIVNNVDPQTKLKLIEMFCAIIRS